MEFLIVGFSTFLGATVAFGVEWLRRQRDERLREEAALNNLILDLAAKRAFLTGEDWDWTEGEIERVVGSIFHARTLIREARLALRPRSAALPPLRRMTMACNTFLEMSERVNEQRLKGSVTSLTRDVASQVQALHALKPDRIYDDLPGSFALDAH